MTRRATVQIETPHLNARGGTWYYQRRVPRELAHLDPRKIIKQSTGVAVRLDPDGSGRAAARAGQINAEVEAAWSDLLAGRNPQERQRAVRGIQQAHTLGIPYRSAADVAVLDLPNILSRTKVLASIEAAQFSPPEAPASRAELAVIDATLGGIAKSGILVSGLMESYFGIVAANHRKKSPNQVRVFKNRKSAACSNFVKVNGDMDVLAITKAHAIAFHGWWSQRLINEKMNSNSANKDIWNMSAMIEVVCKHYGLADPRLFAGMGFKKENNKRRAFTAQWVLDNIWPAGAMPSLNDEARDLTIVLIETGARPAEICGLTKRTICLDANVPFIRIRPEHQELKTEQSERDVPLVGRALEVMRRYPNGFRRYHLNAGNFCATVNKALKKLQPEVDVEAGDKFQTVYCLRHLFKDRLRRAGTDAELRLALMGHDHDADNPNVGNAPDYGEGFEMQQKVEALTKIAFPF